MSRVGHIRLLTKKSRCVGRYSYIEPVEGDAERLGLPVDDGKLGANWLPGEGVNRLLHLSTENIPMKHFG